LAVFSESFSPHFFSLAIGFSLVVREGQTISALQRFPSPADTGLKLAAHEMALQLRIAFCDSLLKTRFNRLVIAGLCL